MHKISKLSSIFILNGIVFSNAFAIEGLNNTNADQRYLYIGGEYGISEPVKNKFMHKSSKTVISLKRSAMYEGRIGYSFYPQMSLELSATFQPKYKLGYLLGETDFTKKIPGKTKVASETYMLNFVYDLADYNGFTPFVTFGGGLARIKTKATTSKAILTDAGKAYVALKVEEAVRKEKNIPANVPIVVPQSFIDPEIAKEQNREVFRIRKNTQNCNAWQVGLGVAKDISENVSISLGGRLQVVHSIKINYDQYNSITEKFEIQPAIKKTIGVWEAGLGIKFKIPV